MSTLRQLTLAVSGEPAGADGMRMTHVFDACNGSIGRSEGCDWILVADGVSRQHALVRYLNEMYFIEDRSTNGMLLNGAPMRKGEPAALRHGDRIQIDTFDIDVRLPSDSQAQQASQAPEDEAQNLDDRVAPRQDAMDAHREGAPSNELESVVSLIPGAGNLFAPGMSLDPLALFEPQSSEADVSWASGPAAPAWNHTPAASDRFRPPALEAGPSVAPLLPDDWNATHVGTQCEPIDDAAGDDSLLSNASGSQRASRTHETTQSPSTLPMEERARAPQALPSSDQADVMVQAARPVISVQQAVQQATQQLVPQSEAKVSQASTDSAPPASSALDIEGGEADLQALLVIAVDAMMDVLRARAELKNSFRLPATLIQRRENNPLKFAPDAHDAVARLLAPSSSAFLSGRAALEDAAVDIRNHQMAMLAGVRSAFDSLLAHFDPARIEEQTAPDARRFSIGGRSRQWERYKAEFASLTQNPDECFRRLFGDEFARAYDAQLGRLKARRD